MSMANLLKCINECGATAKDTSKERKRFLRRHPALCASRLEPRDIEYSKSLAEDKEIKEQGVIDDIVNNRT